MEFAEYGGEQELKDALIDKFSNACTSIFQLHHRILVQIATSGDYPIKLVTAIFREFGRHIRKKVLFGIIAGAEPITSEEGVRAAPLDFGLQLRDRLPFLKFQYVPYWNIQTLLGTTQDYAILDLTAQFNPDDIAILLESVAGPGLIILITPPLKDWPLKVTRYLDQFNFSGAPLPPSKYLAHFIDAVKASHNIFLVEDDKNWLGVTPQAPSDPDYLLNLLPPALEMKTITSLALTTDERDTILLLKTWLKNAIDDPKTKHHFYLHAARGRGKTATLGLSVAELFAENMAGQIGGKKLSLLITSPELLQVQTAFQFLQNGLLTVKAKFQVKKLGELISEVSCSSGTLFYSYPWEVPDRKRVDGIFIDEAGSIPIPILERIENLGLPCVWSSTTFGYEGVGRGFALKFIPSLQNKDKKFMSQTMTTPIRYATGDPIEKMTFNAFFLDADVPNGSLLMKNMPIILNSIHDTSQIDLPSNLILKREDFTKDLEEDRLRGIFGLLVQAHYKTRPSDFVPILDVPDWQLLVFQTQEESPIGAILATPEGGLTSDMANRLASAQKERQGLLVSWVIALHHQTPAFTQQFKGLRIARIAVHPLIRRKGCGTEMLAQFEHVQKKAGVDFLSTSFGTTPQLIQFWMKSGYIPIHIGLKRSPATGEYSLVMVKSLNSRTIADIARFGADFKIKLVDWLRDVLYDADPATMLSILLYQDPAFEQYLPTITLSPSEIRRVHAYCEDILKFKAASDVIRKVFLRYLYDMHKENPTLISIPLKILLAKMQSRSWKTIQVLAHVEPKRAYGMVRELIHHLVKHYQI